MRNTPNLSNAINIKILFCIYDNVAKNTPYTFIANSSEEAQRIFKDIFSSEGSFLSKHPDDYELWSLSNIDISSPSILTATSFKVCLASEFLVNV